MKIPILQGLIDRRILVNYRIEPEALASVLPSPLRPKLVAGFGIGGICLIRLREVRPRRLPRWVGFSSENAAHRIAVLLPNGEEAVFVPRRDTSSRVNSLVGGRIFPGEQHHSRFSVREEADTYFLELSDQQGTKVLSVAAALTEVFPENSVFESLEAASSFFEAGSLGYSATTDPNVLDALELRTKSWRVEPLDVHEVFSGYFENEEIFHRGAATFDCALLMRGIEHEWHSREPLCCPDSRGVASP